MYAATGISKSFGGVCALDGIDLEIRPGEVQALLGANGAGKSTLVKILVGAERPSHGTLTLEGQELRLSGVDEAARLNTLPVQGIPGAETYVGINDAEASKVLLDYLLGKLGANPSGQIVLGTCIPGVSALDTRTQTYLGYLKAKAPGVNIIGPITTTTDPSKNLSTWQQAYAANPDALAYIGNCDNDGPSLARMHEQHPGKYLTGTFDVDPSSLTAIKGGSLDVAIDEAPYARGYLATAALILQAQGKPPITGFVNLKGVLVTSDNVGAIITREATPASIRAGFAASIKAFLADPEKATGPFVLEPIANAYVGAAV